jgi:hypothetical protein
LITPSLSRKAQGLGKFFSRKFSVLKKSSGVPISINCFLVREPYKFFFCIMFGIKSFSILVLSVFRNFFRKFLLKIYIPVLEKLRFLLISIFFVFLLSEKKVYLFDLFLL